MTLDCAGDDDSGNGSTGFWVFDFLDFFFADGWHYAKNLFLYTVQLPFWENTDFHRHLGACGPYSRLQIYVLTACKNGLCMREHDS